MAKQATISLNASETKNTGFRRRLGHRMTSLTVSLLAKTGVTPNTISLIGFLLTLAAAALVVTGHLFAGGIMVLVSGFFDLLDGALARATNQVSKFGGILDSSLDRFSEAGLFLGMLLFFAGRQSTAGIWAAGLALLGSYMVSYIRARAEGAGIDCEVGVFARPERVITMSLGLLLSPISVNFLTTALSIIVFFSFIAAGQRLYHAWKESIK